MVKSAEAYKGSALGWLRSRVPDGFLKTQGGLHAAGSGCVPLLQGRRRRRFREAEVGAGLQDRDRGARYAAADLVRVPQGPSFRVLSPPNGSAALQAPAVVYTKSKETLQKATDAVDEDRHRRVDGR